MPVIEPRLGRAGAFEQLGEHRERRRRVAARRRRLADREADLALRHGDAGERVHHEHHVGAAVAEGLGDAGGDECRAQAHQRRLVRGRRRPRWSGPGPRRRGRLRGTRAPRGRARRPGRCTDTRRRCRGRSSRAARTCRRRSRRRAPSAGPPDRGEGVEGAHAQLQRGVDARRVHGRRRLVASETKPSASSGPIAVDGAAEAVEHAAEQPGSGGHEHRFVAVERTGAPALMPVDAAERHAAHAVRASTRRPRRRRAVPSPIVTRSPRRTSADRADVRRSTPRTAMTTSPVRSGAAARSGVARTAAGCGREARGRCHRARRVPGVPAARRCRCARRGGRRGARRRRRPCARLGSARS